ncbi:MAG: sigma-54 interaction domain-containing protein [Rhodothermales bacterium]
MDRESVQERFGIIGNSAALRHVIDQMRLVARTDVNVLVQGESGVGKEVIAKAIHEMSVRRHKSLIIVNCGAIPEGLIESELFGAEKGAYTGAVERRSGHFEEADGGSIFLDELGEMPLPAQVRLLRVLETGEYSRVGSSTVKQTDTRVIAATNKDLAREVQTGRFREDLYYRISTVEIKIPPLRERVEDILPLLDAFLHEFTQKYNSQTKRLSEEVRQMLTRYRWPGNVRELRNLSQQIVVLVPKQDVDVDDITPFLRGVTAAGASNEIVLSSTGGRTSWQDVGGEDAGAKGRELIYRALLEMRLELREMKELLRGNVTHSDAHETMRDRDFDAEAQPFFIERIENDKPLLPAAQEASYEIESFGNGHEESTAEEEQVVKPVFPTLESSERQLISDALKYYNGNRRQTARALGISERTLYRKLKEIEEEL